MKEKMPIALLIGRGTRIEPLIEHLDSKNASAEITMVVSHKALDKDENGKGIDVPGILAAKKYGINTAYFNLFQMRKTAKEIHPELDEVMFRQEYFRLLGTFLCQNYPKRPQAVFMLGWDLVVSEEFLEFFPGSKKNLYNVINLHPSQLPDDPKDSFVKLSTGVEIPVLRGEHDEVIKEALRLKLPALGACMHITTKNIDYGLVINRTEVPVLTDDTFESYDQRLLKAEEKMIVETVDLFAQNRCRNF